MRFRITNIGTEALTQILVTDATLTGAAIGAIDCDFSAYGGPASGASGGAAVLPPTSGFDCVATLPALGADAVHADEAAVAAVGTGSGIAVTDTDRWNSFTPALPPPPPPPPPPPTEVTTTTTTTTTTPEVTTTTTTVVTPGVTTVPPPPPPSLPPEQLPATGGHVDLTALWAGSRCLPAAPCWSSAVVVGRPDRRALYGLLM